MDAPQHFLCPITQDLMRDPVIGPDGHTYERDAITDWLRTNPYSPVTRGYMTSQSLIPNIALRDSIEQYLASQVVGGTTVPIVSDLTFREQPITIESKFYSNSKKLHVKITPPSTDDRQPILFIPIIDNSGSMGEPADSDEKIEGTGGRRYTRLDIVKFTIQVLLEVMNEKDSIAIVSFSTAARVVLCVTQLNAAGKARALEALKAIKPDSQTNIYDGIRQAARLANAPELAGRHISAMLLTDGLPNVHPPRPMMEALNHYIKIKNPWTLHTFGFGYNLDSELLSKIASWGKGLFGFISDCSMVGNVFIHSVANMLATATPNYKFTYTINSGPLQIYETGPVILGQQRDIVIDLPDDTINIIVNDVAIPNSIDTMDTFASVHSEYLKVIATAISLCKEGHLDLASDILLKFYSDNNPAASPLMRDISSTNSEEGQIGMSPRYFRKWGEHYMRSYLSTQTLQQRMNFKDPGLQIYGGTLFTLIKDAADEKFNDMAPPMPSLGIDTRVVANPAAAVTSFTMASIYNNPNGGCFAGYSYIRMADGSKKQIHELIRGDKLWTPNGPATLKTLVTCNSNIPITCVKLGDCTITAWHPIYVNNTWQFPADLVQQYHKIELNTVYNMVLNEHHIIDVAGILCCTLAHGFKGPVIEHPYFGTEAIINDLSTNSDWDTGNVIFKNLKALRHDLTGLIYKWVDV